jgi:hypothetical protein
MDASERGRLMNRLADLMERDHTYLAVISYYISVIQVPICRVSKHWIMENHIR